MGAEEADGLEGVVDGVAFGHVAVFAKAVAEDDGVNAVVVEEVDEVGGFGSHIEGIVATAGAEDDGGSGVEAAVDGVDFDGGVVDVGDPVDSAGDRFAEVVDFGFFYFFRF